MFIENEKERVEALVEALGYRDKVGTLLTQCSKELGYDRYVNVFPDYLNYLGAYVIVNNDRRMESMPLHKKEAILDLAEEKVFWGNVAYLKNELQIFQRKVASLAGKLTQRDDYELRHKHLTESIDKLVESLRDFEQQDTEMTQLQTRVVELEDEVEKLRAEKEEKA